MSLTLSLQDMLTILAFILAPITTLIGFMWYHFNNSFEKIDKKIDNLRGELKVDLNRIEEKLSEKIDAVRDRVSRIEGQLVPAKIIAFEETRPREIAAQKSVSK